MYYAHFGLTEPPFKITPNTDFFFSGGNRGAILDALVYAISNGEGIIKVVGEVGSGKTMLCRMLQTILPEKIESIYLANPSVAPEEVLHAIAFELQLKLPKNADRLTVMQTLQAYLLERHAQGRQVVIFVEEAQGMPLATLEEIRLLSNLETKQDKLLQIVLFGQPELDENLNQAHIRQLRERITHRFNLGPLSTKDVGEYLIFRLRAAGYHGPHLFTEAAIKTLSQAALGLVRRVNILADKALLAAFAENVYLVTPKHVRAAIQDSEFMPAAQAPWWAGLKPWMRIALALLVVGVVFYPAVTWLDYASPAHPTNATQASVKHMPTKMQTAVPSPPQALSPAAVPDAKLTLLNQRRLATQAWLNQSAPEAITLQIQTLPTNTSPSQDETLNNALQRLSQLVEADRLYWYQMSQNGKKISVILYGLYPQRDAASKALKTLPAEVKLNQPFLRTIAGVKQDIAQTP